MTTIAAKRFVILLHQVADGCSRTDEDHFDWLFETGPTLTTFATATIDDLKTTTTTGCDRLPDHRIEYLDFEGLIPNRGELRNRGSVRRIAAGTFVATTDTVHCFRVTLTVQHSSLATAKTDETMRLCLSSKVEFQWDSDQGWMMTYSPVQLKT